MCGQIGVIDTSSSSGHNREVVESAFKREASQSKSVEICDHNDHIGCVCSDLCVLWVDSVCYRLSVL